MVHLIAHSHTVDAHQTQALAPTHTNEAHLTTTTPGTSTIGELLLVTEEIQPGTTRNRPATIIYTRPNLSYHRFHDQTHLEESQN